MISIALAFLIGVLTLLQFSVLPPIELAWLLLPALAAIVWGKYFYIKTSAASRYLASGIISFREPAGFRAGPVSAKVSRLSANKNIKEINSV